VDAPQRGLVWTAGGNLGHVTRRRTIVWKEVTIPPDITRKYRLEFLSSMHYYAFTYPPIVVSHSNIIQRSCFDPDSIPNVGAILYPFPAIIDPRLKLSYLFGVARDMNPGVGIFHPTANVIITSRPYRIWISQITLLGFWLFIILHETAGHLHLFPSQFYTRRISKMLPFH